jgi:type IV secretory pathway VirB4 component
MSPQNATMYRDLTLNDTEISRIQKGRPKRDYYFKSPKGSRLFEMELGPVALSFLAGKKKVSLPDSLKRAEELQTQFGERWPGEWLKECGLEAESQEFYRLLGGYYDYEDREIGTDRRIGAGHGVGAFSGGSS